MGNGRGILSLFAFLLTVCKNQTGRILCDRNENENENLSDEQLLKHFDWLVEGVEVYE